MGRARRDEACLTQKQGEERVGGGGRSSWGLHGRTPLPRPRAERQALSRPEGTLLHVAATGLGLRGTHFEKRCATRARHPGEGAPVSASAQQPGLASGTGHDLLRTGVASTVHKLSDGAPRALATRGLPPWVREGPCRPASPLDQGAPAASSPHPASVPAGGFQRVAVLSPSRMGVGRRVPRSAGGRGSAGLGGASDSRVHPTIGSPHPRRGLSL